MERYKKKTNFEGRFLQILESFFHVRKKNLEQNPGFCLIGRSKREASPLAFQTKNLYTSEMSPALYLPRITHIKKKKIKIKNKVLTHNLISIYLPRIRDI